MLRDFLRDEPDHPIGLGWLALCRAEGGAHEEARELGRRAVAAAPDLPYVHYLLARVLLACNRKDEAEATIDHLLAIAPDDEDHWGLKALVRAERRDWNGALDAADRGLAIAPDDDVCLNVRAMALTRLGLRQLAVETMEGALRKHPEDAHTHANHGWTLLHRGEVREAEAHFREALRLDPDLEWAREGVLEALKARSRLYRVFLRYKLWMDGLPFKRGLLVIVGGYFAYRLAWAGAERYPAAAPLLWTAVAAYVAFCVLTWFADSIFNALLLAHPLGRHALTRREKADALAVPALLVAGLACAGAGFALDRDLLLVTGLYTALLAAPVHTAFEVPLPRAARLQWGFTAVVAALGVVTLLLTRWVEGEVHVLAPLQARAVAVRDRSETLKSRHDEALAERDRLIASGAIDDREALAAAKERAEALLAEARRWKAEEQDVVRELEDADFVARVQRLDGRQGLQQILSLAYPILCIWVSGILAVFLVTRMSRR